jgi:hypothetical protein
MNSSQFPDKIALPVSNPILKAFVTQSIKFRPKIISMYLSKLFGKEFLDYLQLLRKRYKLTPAGGHVFKLLREFDLESKYKEGQNELRK